MSLKIKRILLATGGLLILLMTSSIAYAQNQDERANLSFDNPKVGCNGTATLTVDVLIRNAVEYKISLKKSDGSYYLIGDPKSGNPDYQVLPNAMPVQLGVKFTNLAFPGATFKLEVKYRLSTSGKGDWPIWTVGSSGEAKLTPACSDPPSGGTGDVAINPPTLPDLVTGFARIALPPPIRTWQKGQIVTVAVNATNRGGLTAPGTISSVIPPDRRGFTGYTIKLYLTPAAAPAPGIPAEIRMAEIGVPPQVLTPNLKPGQTSVLEAKFTVPQNLPTGDYKLCSFIDPRLAVKESNEGNNRSDTCLPVRVVNPQK